MTSPSITPGENDWRGHPFRELRWYAELVRLLADPVLHGAGMPKGDGRSVLLLPGLLAGDSSLWLLAHFLRSLGYRPAFTGIMFNTGCGDSFDQRILIRLEQEYQRSGRRVAIIGHSRGGHYARSLAARRPDLVSDIITLGSGTEDPMDAAPLARGAAHALRGMLTRCDEERAARGCLTVACRCPFAEGYARPFPAEVGFSSIYSRTDGVVQWRSCVANYADCVEVPGSHIGMAFNRHVFREIARILAGTAAAGQNIRLAADGGNVAADHHPS